MLSIAFGPKVYAFKDFVAKLNSRQTEHQLPQPRHEKTAERERIESQPGKVGAAFVGRFLIFKCRGYGME
ncbi:hypothetical protein D3C81_1040310 [compost metagenome]